MPSRENLVWIDLEMTGLDAQKDVVLEAALIVTDRELNPLDEYCCAIHQPEEALAMMSPVVREMHEGSGLVERVRASEIDVAAADAELLRRVAAHCAPPATLCGNSIPYDKRFIERYMPGLDAHLHYRTMDVSSLKILAKLWHGEGAVFDKPTEGKQKCYFCHKLEEAE